MNTHRQMIQGRQAASTQPDHPIRERLPDLRGWKPLPPLDLGWKFKPLSSARAQFKLLTNNRFELTISHDIVIGVTPPMLAWWFSHIDDTIPIQGQPQPRYRVWHPFCHIHYRDLSRASDGSGSAGTRRHIVEAFGADRRFLVNIIDRVVHLDEKGILLVTEQAGISVGFGSLLAPVPFQFSSLEHQFFPVSNGTRYESRLLIGLDSTIGKYLVNCIVRPLFIGEEMARAWLKHNVEEVGNFEYFLPGLYGQVNG